MIVTSTRVRVTRASTTGGIRCQSLSSSTTDSKQNDNEPWWSLSSLHKKVSMMIATSLPEESPSGVHQVFSKKLIEVDSHKSGSINEAIVSARAREAHHRASKPSVTTIGIAHDNARSHHSIIEKETQVMREQIEKQAFEKAWERMQLELQATEERLRRKEEERLQQRRNREEQERNEKEFHRGVAFERWRENAAKARQQEESERRKHLKNEQTAEMQTISSSTSSPQQRQSTPLDHPVLGPQIAHLPYKRIHLTPASTLASLPVYETTRLSPRPCKEHGQG